jgi:hypothetical protein
VTVQVLAAHAPLPFAIEQALPQKPQSPVEVVTSVSHTVPRSESHSPKPTGHGESWQLPESQIWLPDTQAVAQLPQCVGSLLTLVSQPLAARPSQSLQPGSQLALQLPEAHEAAPCGFVQLAPHAPHAVVVVSGVSQPFVVSPSQSAKPDAHVGVQSPREHAVEPFGFSQLL